MYKNIAGQHLSVFAWNGATGAPATGDAANITAWYSKDGAALLGTDDVNPVEIGFGVYVFNLTQSESNCDLLIWTAESATADIDIKPKSVYTQDLTLVSTHSEADVKTAMEAVGSKLTDVHDASYKGSELTKISDTEYTEKILATSGTKEFTITKAGDIETRTPV